MNRNYLLLALFIGALVALNVYILLGGNQSSTCYKDACIVGEKDPVNELKAVLNSSKNAIIVTEGDAGNSQKNQFLSGAMLRLVKNFGHLGLTTIALEQENGEFVKCECLRKFNATLFENCSNLAYCTSIRPNETTVLMKLSYPSFDNNKIVISNRTIDFRGKSGEDTFALVSELFERLLSQQ